MTTTSNDGRKDGQGGGGGGGEPWIPSEEDMAYVDEAALQLMPLAVQFTLRQLAVLDGAGPPRVEPNPPAAAQFAYQLAGALGSQRMLERAAVRRLRVERAQRASGPNGTIRLADRAGGTEGDGRKG